MSQRREEPRSVGDYVIEYEIGKGSFAQVYRAHHKDPPRQLVAVKSVTRSKLSPKLLENLEGEISILTSMRHTNIVDLRNCIYSDEYIHMIMEYCPGGDLSQYIRKGGDVPPWNGDSSTNPLAASQRRLYPHPEDGGLNDTVVRYFLAQLCSALRFLRSRDIVHRDIKPQNLLLRIPDDECLASGQPREIPLIKVADFGFARALPAASLAKTLCGSPLYMAPEILRYEKYDAKADLWSVGAVLYEMSVGKPPFRATNHVELLRRIEQSNDRIKFPDERSAPSLARDAARRRAHGELPRLPPHLVAPDIKGLIRKLLKRHPVERVSFDEFFTDPVIAAVPYEGRAIIKDDLAASMLDETLAALPLLNPPGSTQDEAELDTDTLLASHMRELPLTDKGRTPNTAFGFEPDTERTVVPAPDVPPGVPERSTLPPSALSRAISMAGALPTPPDAAAPAKPRASFPSSPMLDGHEDDEVALLHSLAQKSYVLGEFADAKMGEYAESTRPSSGLSPAGSSPHSLAMQHHESAAGEGLALYLRALGFLQRGLEKINEYALALDGAEPSEEMRELAHWFRTQFDDCYERSTYARRSCSTQGLPECIQHIDRQIFEKALELARAAALDELEGNREGGQWEPTNCILAYETASSLLLGLLDPTEDQAGLSMHSMSTVEKFLKSIHKRLGTLRNAP